MPTPRSPARCYIRTRCCTRTFRTGSTKLESKLIRRITDVCATGIRPPFQKAICPATTKLRYLRSLHKCPFPPRGLTEPVQQAPCQILKVDPLVVLLAADW